MVAIPDGFGQVNFMLNGSAVPTGAEMTMAFRIDSPMTVDEAINAIGAAIDVDNPFEYACDTIQLNSLHVKFGPSDTGPSADMSLVRPGIVTTGAVPPNVSMLLQKQTDNGGRSGRGRMYQPGLPESKIDQQGIWDTTLRSDIEGAWETFRAEMVSSDLPCVVLHGPGAPLSIPSTITNIAGAALAATQRRRLRR